VFLSAGIVYGGWWSYRTLGWGGYWAWDPVENASFMPWLTILSPEGRVLESVDIPAKERAAVEVALPRPGRYVFYCGKFLHRWPFGMEGVFVAR
jgi:hypothetical protein